MQDVSTMKVLIWMASVALHCGAIPIIVVVRLISMDSNIVLGVTSFHCLFVLTESYLEGLSH